MAMMMGVVINLRNREPHGASEPRYRTVIVYGPSETGSDRGADNMVDSLHLGTEKSMRAFKPPPSLSFSASDTPFTFSMRR